MNISAESRLLLNCSRLHIDAAAREEIIQAASQNPDWAYLKRAAIKNRVFPLLYNGIRQAGESAVPPAVLDEWRIDAEANAASHERSQAMLVEALAVLDGAGIQAVPFKGVVFALFVYGDLALRRTGDIDLLVRPADFIKARDLLIRNGYSQYYFGHAEVSTVQGTLMHDSKPTSIDLHYALTPYYQHTNMDQATRGSKLAPGRTNRLDIDSTHWFFSLDCEPLWDRLSSMTIANRAVPIFSLEDMLLLAAINGIKENWRMLVRATDIADLVRTRAEMDWDRVFGQVSAMRFERKFEFGLLLARDLCGMPLPDEISRRIGASATLRSLACQTRDRFCSEFIEADLEEFRLLCALYTMDSIRDRAWYSVYILRRLRRWSFRASQYLAFFCKLARQIRLSMVEAMGSGGKR